MNGTLTIERRDRPDATMPVMVSGGKPFARLEDLVQATGLGPEGGGWPLVADVAGFLKGKYCLLAVPYTDDFVAVEN